LEGSIVPRKREREGRGRGEGGEERNVARRTTLINDLTCSFFFLYFVTMIRSRCLISQMGNFNSPNNNFSK